MKCKWCGRKLRHAPELGYEYFHIDTGNAYCRGSYGNGVNWSPKDKLGEVATFKDYYKIITKVLASYKTIY